MHRRRYFWAALACLAIGGLSIAALRLVDVTDTEVQGALNLFFQAAGAVAAVLSVVLAVVGLRRERPPQAAAAEGSSSAATSTHRGSYLEVRDADQSLRTYVEQMQAVIGAHPAQPKQFVELSAVSEPSARHEPVLTPRLELITLESEPRSADGPVDVIDLSAIADGFMNGSRHVALLGEPGSGSRAPASTPPGLRPASTGCPCT